MVKFNPKTYKKKLDTLWSQVVRARDGRCIMCGRTENLQAHHTVVTKGRSKATRWDIDNGLTLCYSCHFFGVHMKGSVHAFPQEFMKKWMKIVDERIPEETQERLRQESNSKIIKDRIIDLEPIKEYLESELEKYA